MKFRVQHVGREKGTAGKGKGKGVQKQTYFFLDVNPFKSFRNEFTYGRNTRKIEGAGDVTELLKFHEKSFMNKNCFFCSKKNFLT